MFTIGEKYFKCRLLAVSLSPLALTSGDPAQHLLHSAGGKTVHGDGWGGEKAWEAATTQKVLFLCAIPLLPSYL